MLKLIELLVFIINKHYERKYKKITDKVTKILNSLRLTEKVSSNYVNSSPSKLLPRLIQSKYSIFPKIIITFS